MELLIKKTPIQNPLLITEFSKFMGIQFCTDHFHYLKIKVATWSNNDWPVKIKRTKIKLRNSGQLKIKMSKHGINRYLLVFRVNVFTLFSGLEFDFASVAKPLMPFFWGFLAFSTRVMKSLTEIKLKLLTN